MSKRKDYIVKVRAIDLTTEEQDGGDRTFNFSDPEGRGKLDRMIFWALNSGKGITIELDKKIPVA